MRESLYVFAAVCPQLGHLTALIFPSANSQMMTLFLAHVAAELSDYFIVMLVDRAGWHMSHHVTIPENICLLPQLLTVLNLIPQSICGRICEKMKPLIATSTRLSTLKTRYVPVSTASHLIQKDCAQ